MHRLRVSLRGCIIGGAPLSVTLRIMSEPKTNCSDCGATILQRTADTHDGRCVPCHDKVAAIPPQDFELPSELTKRLAAFNMDPAFFRQIAWRDGVGFVHRFIEKLEERNELYRKWSPRLREFADECRKSRPLPSDSSLSSSDREKQRIFEAKLERPKMAQDMTVAICRMPLIAMAIAQRVWPSDDEQTVVLTFEEKSRWDEIYSHPGGAFWWFAHFWWNIDDSREQEFPLTQPDGPEFLWWNDDDVPNAETPWLLTVGNLYGPLAGGGRRELWSWNGRRAKFLKNLDRWVN